MWCKIILLFALVIVSSTHSVAQTQSKKQTKPKTSGKVSGKTPVKKTAPKEINVYVCTDDKDKCYHKRSTCQGLNKCSGEIKNIKSQATLSKFNKKKQCARCFTK